MTVYEYIRTETDPGKLYDGIRAILKEMDARGRYPEDWTIKEIQRRADARYTELKVFSMTPAQVWAAWKAQEINAGQLAAWQERHNYYFNDHGGQILARRLFHRLERDTFTPGRYIVLNDGIFYAGFYASSDADAIKQFESGVYMR